MSVAAMVAMVGGITVGFVCIVVAAGGYRAGWRTATWLAWVIAALVFLTIIPVVSALTIGIHSH